MAIVENWLPPSRENWGLIVYLFQFFPLITFLQWILPWYGAGKTSAQSILNMPGKVAWISMEIPSIITMVYVMNTLPAEAGIAQLPWQNKAMAGLYVMHYVYRAIIGPLIAPSMSPIHVLVWLAAICFQMFNSVSISGWLGGYGPTTSQDWQANGGQFKLGMIIFCVSLAGNIYHDDILREIRRAALRNQKQKAAKAEKGAGNGVDKFYVIPEDGLFRWIFFPHYLCEWIEWGGFWLMGGGGFVPGRNFVLNEVSTMFPRAVSGKKWYLERFGREKVGARRAIIPGLW